jgi:hypothetical protein
MAARIHDKNVIVICDCIGCKNKPTWRQGFMTKKGLIVVDLCEDHHFILRTKVPRDIPLDENVLKWLLMQYANHHRVIKYGIITGSDDIEFLRELDKIDIEFE